LFLTGQEETILVDYMDFEGQAINSPSFFNREKFELWKLKKISFLEYCNVHLLEKIETGIPSLLNATGNLLPRDTWSADQSYKY